MDSDAPTGTGREVWSKEGGRMNQPKRVSSLIYAFFPIEVEGFESLAELALDMP